MGAVRRSSGGFRRAAAWAFAAGVIGFALLWVVSDVRPTLPPGGVRFGPWSVAAAKGRILIADTNALQDVSWVNQAVDVGPGTYVQIVERAPSRPVVDDDRWAAIDLRSVTSSIATPTVSRDELAPGVTRFDAWPAVPPAAPLPTSMTGYAGFSTTTGAIGSIGTITNIGLWLPLAICGTGLLAVVPGAIRRRRDDVAARRAGVDGPVFRMPRRTVRPIGSVRRAMRNAWGMLAILSALLAIAIAVIWGRSERETWRHSWGVYPEDSVQLALTGGQFSGQGNRVARGPAVETYHDIYILHLACGVSTYNGPNYSSWSFRLPLWIPTLLLTALAGLWLVSRGSRVRRDRVRRGHCPSCNYDLRASPTRCPECGLARLRSS